MALSLLVSPTYSGSGILLKSCVTCYVQTKSEDLKSYDMQTISAIPGEFSEVMTMARNLQFPC